MKKLKSNAKIILNRLGKMSEFLTDLDPHAGKNDCFDFPLEIIRKNLLFDVSVLYKVSNVIEDRLIIEVVKVFDPDGLRLDLKEGKKLRIFMDNRDRRYLNEVTAFLTQKTSCKNVPGMGSDIISYVYLPESFGGAYLFGGDFYGKESSIEDYEIAGVEIMSNFLSAILLKTQFERQAEYDNLTGLFNSAKIKFKVDTLLKRFKRKPDSKACIVLGDIDFFKAVNDTYGHIQGDLVLKTMGKILSSSLREAFDMAGRYGGEEFLLIFDETGKKEVFKIIERLRKKIARMPFKKTDKSGVVIKNQFLNITMSFGICEYNKDAEIKTESDWISRADSALYEAKKTGRNKTTIFEGH